jgi:thiol-disulfide isomerase/thioredoxin
MWRSACLALGLLVVMLPRSEALTVGDKAVDFSSPELGTDKLITLTDFRGQVVYLDFWASWCGPCRVSLPAMEVMYRELKDQGFTVLAVNLDADVADAQKFLLSRPVSYPIIYDAEQILPKIYAVKGMPTAYILDRTGLVRDVHEGFRPGDESRIKHIIEALLAEEES